MAKSERAAGFEDFFRNLFTGLAKQAAIGGGEEISDVPSIERFRRRQDQRRVRKAFRDAGGGKDYIPYQSRARRSRDELSTGSAISLQRLGLGRDIPFLPPARRYGPSSPIAPEYPIGQYVPVQSSWIQSFKFDPFQGSYAGRGYRPGVGNRGDLTMKIRNDRGGRTAGKDYKFYRVPIDVFYAAASSPSPGRFYWTTLAKIYASYSIYRRRVTLDDPDARSRRRDPRAAIRFSASVAAGYRRRPPGGLYAGI